MEISNTTSSYINQTSEIISNRNISSIISKSEMNLIQLDRAAFLLYFLLSFVIIILIALAIVIYKLNKKTVIEPESKYTSFINLRKSNSGQYRLVIYI